MKRKINYLAFIPFFGGVLLLFSLYFKALTNKINRKEYIKFFIFSGLITVLSWIVVILIMTGINQFVNVEELVNLYVVIFILGCGCVLNWYTFTWFNKNEHKLYNGKVIK